MAFADVLKTQNAALTAANTAAVNAAKAACAVQTKALNDQINVLKARIAVLEAGNAPPSLEPDFSTFNWQKWGGDALDLTGYAETFRSDFTTNPITGPTGAGPWYAPVHTPFGGAPFKPPGSVPDPFLVANGACRIRMEKVGTAWQSGLMQTMKAGGIGFKQSMGYFEMRAKFPLGTPDARGPKGAWPAFWLLSANDFDSRAPDHRIEIDVVEAYGNDYNHHAAVHLKPRGVPKPGDPADRIGKSIIRNLLTANHYTTGVVLFGPAKGNMFDGQFHTYGVMLNDQYMTVFYDGVSIERFPMLSYFKTPLYMLVNLALFDAQASLAVSPMDMTIDYVRAMAKTS